MYGRMVVQVYEFLIYYKILSCQLPTLSSLPPCKLCVDLGVVGRRGIPALPRIEL
jgi:hypothetical protein